jgi:thiol-disulfide isomerase/thioredoxin
MLLACWSVAAIAQANNSSPGAADQSPASEGNHRFKLVKGATIPDFVYTDFDGAPHRFSDLHAEFRLIDFWATWCLPCVADLASKTKAYKKFHPRGFEILGIDGEERETGAAERLIAERAISWPQARFDRSLVEGKFAVYQFPTFVLVDSNNVIVSVTTNSSGELAGDALSKLLSTLLAPSR